MMAIDIVMTNSNSVKPDALADRVPAALGVPAAIRILESEVCMVWMLGAQPYVKLTAVFQRADL
jgi:hypothetical protein